MEHLSRWRPAPLAERTITDREALFHSLDLYGPQGSHFDLLEYSDTEVCAAISVPLPGQPRCVALSLPFAERHRLVAAAGILNNRDTGLPLTLVLATLHQVEATAMEESGSSYGQDSAPGGYRLGSGREASSCGSRISRTGEEDLTCVFLRCGDTKASPHLPGSGAHGRRNSVPDPARFLRHRGPRFGRRPISAQLKVGRSRTS